MMREALMGAAAGAVGTVALNVSTYADMAIRGRPSSSVPAQVAGKLAGKVGIDLSSEGSDGEAAENRKSGLGALSGYVVGLGVGTAYGVIRPHLGDVSKPLAGACLGLAAMAGSDVPATALGVTDPRKWGAGSWASDIVPHLAYGLLTAAAYDFFTTALAGARRHRVLR
jgi:hypothetical protein